MSRLPSAQKFPGSYPPRILLSLVAILLLLVIWFYPDAEPETVSPENPDGRMQSGAGEQSEGVPPVESHSGGRGSIDGLVRRGGRGVAAQIEVRPLEEGDWLGEDLMVPGPPVRVVKASATAGFLTRISSSRSS